MSEHHGRSHDYQFEDKIWKHSDQTKSIKRIILRLVMTFGFEIERLAMLIAIDGRTVDEICV